MFGCVAVTSTIITVFGYKTFRLVKANTIPINHSSNVESEGQPSAAAAPSSPPLPATATVHHRTLDPWKVSIHRKRHFTKYIKID
jgi:hypothetical protein